MGEFRNCEFGLEDAEDAAEGVGGVLVIPDGNCVNAHLHDGVIVAARLGHVAEVEDVGFFDVEFFEEVSHTENFVHAWGNGVDRGGTANFVVEFRGEFFSSVNDLLAFLAVGVPGVFCFSVGMLAESRESDLGEAVFDDFVAVLELIFLPETEFAGGFFDSFADFLDLFVGEREVVNLLPLVARVGDFEIVARWLVAVVLGALGDKEV